ncbi:MAG: iron ABC transporter permease [Angelakisella sp.]
MSIRIKAAVLLTVAVVVMLLAVGIGSVYIPPGDIVEIVLGKLSGESTLLPTHITGIVWNMRLPRVLLAFMVGALLSVSGTIMQSVLRNPLASSYTLGVSAGAALGVGVAVFSGLSMAVLGVFTLPVIGLSAGILTVVLAVTFAQRIDKSLSNHTIILVGMVFSLFINALLTLLSSLSGETLERVIYWQMGSFALKDWSFVYALLPVCIVGILIAVRYSRELDNLTFGEEAAFAVGVNVKKTKWLLLSVSAALTGCAVALAGVIGFVDLVAPHMARKLFSSAHRIVLPMSAVLGGILMVVADVVARTIASPSELPVGAVTAVIGAPFFVYIYFKKKR